MNEQGISESSRYIVSQSAIIQVYPWLELRSWWSVYFRNFIEIEKEETRK